MKRLLVLALVLLGFTSCGKLLEPLYIYLPGTEWYYELDGKHAFVHFGHDGQASVIQKNLSSGATQENYGEYEADGSHVYINCTDGTSFKLIRTFSHMKNSKSKNMTRIYPASYSSVAGTVWMGVDMSDLYIYYFKDENTLLRAAFTVTMYEEGVPYGWNLETLPYTLDGTTFTAGEYTGWLFSETLFADNRWHATYPAPAGSGTSDIAGTIWSCVNGSSSSAGAVIFDSGYSFTRVQVVNSKTQFLVERGTYTKNGAVVTMTLNGKQDNCTINGERFTFMERTYATLH